MYLGAHVSTSGGVDKAPANGRDLGCQAIQVFTRNQMQWRARPLAEKEAAAFQQEMATCKIHACRRSRLLLDQPWQPRGRSVAKVVRSICR